MQEGDAIEGADMKIKTPKKKSPTIEENKSKKEHINVVFIGHVGKCPLLKLIGSLLSFD